jgi:hypothetical protein
MDEKRAVFWQDVAIVPLCASLALDRYDALWDSDALVTADIQASRSCFEVTLRGFLFAFAFSLLF